LLNRVTVHAVLLFLSVLVWKATELQQALSPIIEKLFAQDPEALPFQYPVDPEALGIPVSIVVITIVLKFQL